MLGKHQSHHSHQGRGGPPLPTIQDQLNLFFLWTQNNHWEKNVFLCKSTTYDRLTLAWKWTICLSVVWVQAVHHPPITPLYHQSRWFWSSGPAHITRSERKLRAFLKQILANIYLIWWKFVSHLKCVIIPYENYHNSTLMRGERGRVDVGVSGAGICRCRHTFIKERQQRHGYILYCGLLSVSTLDNSTLFITQYNFIKTFSTRSTWA